MKTNRRKVEAERQESLDTALYLNALTNSVITAFAILADAGRLDVWVRSANTAGVDNPGPGPIGMMTPVIGVARNGRCIQFEIQVEPGDLDTLFPSPEAVKKRHRAKRTGVVAR